MNELNELCCLCGPPSETIQHVITSELDQNNYEHQYDQVTKIVCQEFMEQFHHLEKPYFPYYKYRPEVVL